MQTLLQHPRLMDCRRLFLRDYEVWINIGVHDFEKTGEQRVLINVDLFIPMALSTPSKDTLDEVVDYDFIRRSIAEAQPGDTVLIAGKGHETWQLSRGKRLPFEDRKVVREELP